jgi:hypothetical protein
MRKLFYVTLVTVVFPLNALADDMRTEPHSLGYVDQGPSIALSHDQAITDFDLGSPTDVFKSPDLTLPQEKPVVSGPLLGVDWASFEKAHPLLSTRNLAERQGAEDLHGATGLMLSSPDSDRELLAYKGDEPREIKIGTIGTPEKHKTVADFKLSGPNAVEVTFSFFF